MAALAPGFGGMYFEGDDVVVLRLREPATESVALAALIAVLGAELEELLVGRAVRVAEAAYDWRKLKGWYEAALPVWETGVVTSSDINEQLNRIVYGIEPGADGARVRGMLDDLGIPAEAVVLEERAPDEWPPVQRQKSSRSGSGGCGGAFLSDEFCPLIGGIMIDGEDDPDGSQNLCTLGFVVRSITSLEPNRFVTNSHCTQILGGGSQPEGTQYYQPTPSLGRLVGQEILDPDYSSSLFGCPAGFVCRYSDAALISLIGGATGDLGMIARTTGPDNGSDFIGSTPYGHRFEIVGEQTMPYMGLPLNKVGWQTAWTQGRVTATCVTSTRRASGVAYLCQARMDAEAMGGDSGSPVFSLEPMGTPEMIDEVTLYGLLNGMNTSTGESIFSRLGYVEQELGTLITH